MSKSASTLLILLISLCVSLPLWAGESHWIDVRGPNEFSAGHVEGAINIPHTEITSGIGGVTENKDADLYLYCRSGRRSGLATNALREMGYTNVVNVGGYHDAEKIAAEMNAD
ncbi:MAG: rhodanese-like domain-containing protein [Xanthomonadales bacterium]|nr:rhodanese-like domain-containing protein [Xanthomonadales bacterium]